MRRSSFGRLRRALRGDDKPPTQDGLRGLRQTHETWQLFLRLARIWVDEDDGHSYRPIYCQVGLPGVGTILQSEFLPEGPMDPEALRGLLFKAMQRPLSFSGGPRRPAVVEVNDEALLLYLLPHLAEIGVRGVYRSSMPMLAKVADKLERQMVRATPPPGLLAVKGATPESVGRIIGLAAEYHRLAPWRYFSDAHPIEIRNPAEGPPRYGVVMGSGGEVYGLAVYDSAKDLAKLLRLGNRPTIFREMSWLALIFEVPRAISCEDLDDIERYGWPVNGPRAYPLLGRTDPKGQLILPTPRDLAWLEGTLAALVEQFTYTARRKPTYPFERRLRVETADGEMEVALAAARLER